jgi:hypothetical protein
MIVLECNYSKKIGLPNYSSHQFSVSLKTELADITLVEIRLDSLALMILLIVPKLEPSYADSPKLLADKSSLSFQPFN